MEMEKVYQQFDRLVVYIYHALTLKSLGKLSYSVL